MAGRVKRTFWRRLPHGSGQHLFPLSGNNKNSRAFLPHIFFQLTEKYMRGAARRLFLAGWDENRPIIGRMRKE
jgi:hypothetical protein